jgi:hypothetical protein
MSIMHARKSYARRLSKNEKECGTTIVSINMDPFSSSVKSAEGYLYAMVFVAFALDIAGCME